MKVKVFFFSAVMATGMIITSCDKTDEPAVQQTADIEAVVQDDAEVEDILDAVAEQVDSYTSLDIEGSYAEVSSLKSSMEDVEYPVVTREHLVEGRFFPVRITIDYGPENHKILVRRTKEAWVRGKIIIEKTGPHYVPNTQRTVTFEDYYFNDNHVEGDKLYENLGKNDAGNFVFAWTVEIKVTTPNGKWISKIENKQREKIAGADTKKIWDDEFLVTGSSSGSRSNGFTYNRTILDENPLLRKRVCRFPVKGTVSIVNSKRTYTLDYGDGECDALATITDSEGNTKEIVLGRK
jgi:hypothetical protein